LALIDLRGVDVTGRDAEMRCDAARITLNKNSIPFDPAKPMIASGVRVGTPSVTTQGMGTSEMKEVASLIGRAIKADVETDSGRAEAAAVAEEVGTLVAKFPAYPAPSA
jgi:glycine hydroxymethyltransferase